MAQDGTSEKALVAPSLPRARPFLGGPAMAGHPRPRPPPIVIPAPVSSYGAGPESGTPPTDILVASSEPSTQGRGRDRGARNSRTLLAFFPRGGGVAASESPRRGPRSPLTGEDGGAGGYARGPGGEDNEVRSGDARAPGAWRCGRGFFAHLHTYVPDSGFKSNSTY